MSNRELFERNAGMSLHCNGVCSFCGSVKWTADWRGHEIILICPKCAKDVLPQLYADAVVHGAYRGPPYPREPEQRTGWPLPWGRGPARTLTLDTRGILKNAREALAAFGKPFWRATHGLLAENERVREVEAKEIAERLAEKRQDAEAPDRRGIDG